MLLPSFMAIWCANLASVVDLIARLTGQTPSTDNLEGTTLGLYEAGKRVSASEYLQAKMMLNQVARAAAKFHRTYDLWLTATLGSPPLRLGTLDIDERDPDKAFAPLIDYVSYTAIQNITGQPAISLPLYWNETGLPIGTHFVAPFGDELTLLQLAIELEQAEPWFERYATIKL
jgi:amidase